MKGSLLRTLPGHRGQMVTEVAFSPDGLLLASSGLDRSARLYDAQRGKVLHRFPQLNRQMRALTFSPDSKYLLMGDTSDEDARTGGGEFQVWDVAAEPALVRTLKMSTANVESLAFSRDGELASGSTRGDIWLWAFPGWKVKQKLPNQRYPAESLTFSPDGRLLANAQGGMGHKTSKVLVWDLQTGKLARELAEETDCVYGTGFSLDGKLLVSGHDDGSLHLRSTKTWKLLQSVQAHSDAIRPLVFSPSGDLLATGSRCSQQGQTLGEIKLWRMPECKLALTLVGHEGLVTTLAFSPDRKLLASGSHDGKVKLWEIG
jgi:WD40 repeat protein